MAADAKLPFDAALDSIIGSLERKFILKKYKLSALNYFITKKDVFALLPTGCGKSRLATSYVQTHLIIVDNRSAQ